MSKISRLEIIDEQGRAYVRNRDVDFVKYSVQDEGRTLKLFVNRGVIDTQLPDIEELLDNG